MVYSHSFSLVSEWLLSSLCVPILLLLLLLRFGNGIRVVVHHHPLEEEASWLWLQQHIPIPRFSRPTGSQGTDNPSHPTTPMTTTMIGSLKSVPSLSLFYNSIHPSFNSFKFYHHFPIFQFSLLS